MLMQRGLPPVFGQLALLLSELSFKFAAAVDVFEIFFANCGIPGIISANDSS